MQSPIKEIVQSVGPEGKEQEVFVDEVTVEMGENLTVGDLGGMTGGVLSKRNNVSGRKHQEEEGESCSWKEGYRPRVMGHECS